jgi:hypothetical protein
MMKEKLMKAHTKRSTQREKRSQHETFITKKAIEKEKAKGKNSECARLSATPKLARNMPKSIESRNLCVHEVKKKSFFTLFSHGIFIRTMFHVSLRWNVLFVR